MAQPYAVLGAGRQGTAAYGMARWGMPFESTSQIATSRCSSLHTPFSYRVIPIAIEGAEAHAGVHREAEDISGQAALVPTCEPPLVGKQLLLTASLRIESLETASRVSHAPTRLQRSLLRKLRRLLRLVTKKTATT